MQHGDDRRPHDDWHGDHEDRPRRRGMVARAVWLVKLALVLGPIALFAASFVLTDCGSRSGGGLGQLVKAGVCARGVLLNGALALPGDLAVLRRAMN